MRILVGYASRHGATRGIAERIGDALAAQGHEVAVEALGTNPAPEPYEAFVIGSAAYNHHWLGDATRWVRRHHVLLATRPVWLFSSGPVGEDRFDAEGRDQLVVGRPVEFDELERLLSPRGTTVLFGAWDPAAPPIGILEHLSAPFLRRMRDVMPVGDFRDWPAIEAWATDIGTALGEPQAASR